MEIPRLWSDDHDIPLPSPPPPPYMTERSRKRPAITVESSGQISNPDAPIYLLFLARQQCGCVGHWYKIEESKELPSEEETPELPSEEDTPELPSEEDTPELPSEEDTPTKLRKQDAYPQEPNSKWTPEGKSLVLLPSDVDDITSIRLPDPGFPPFIRTIFLLNSRLYMLGNGDSENIYRLDLHHLDDGWQEEGRDLTSPCLVEAMASNNRFIYVLELDEDDSDTYSFRCYDTVKGLWWCLPKLLAGFRYPRLLAITDTIIYFCVTEILDPPPPIDAPYRSVIVSFDIKLSKWEIFDPWFRGCWTPGVILYNTYMFIFGRLVSKVNKEPSIYVYSLENRSLLTAPIEGLEYGTCIPIGSGCQIFNYASLSQISDDNKLAFLWTKRTAGYTEIHCSKFYVDRIFGECSHKRPTFCAKAVSYGCYLVKGFCPCFISAWLFGRIEDDKNSDPSEEEKKKRPEIQGADARQRG